VVVGDCLIDVVVRAPPPLPGADRPGSIRLATGGQAANVAVRLARQGRQVRLVAPLGADAAGELLAAGLAADGVELDALPAARTGAVVVMVERNGERTMLSDRVPLATDPTSLADALRPRLAGAGWIHASGYALLDPATGLALAALLRDTTARLSADGGSVQAAGGSRDRLAAALREARPNLLFASRSEAATLADGAGAATDESAGRAGAREALAELAAAVRDRFELEVVVVTGGLDGSAAAVAGRRGRKVVPARPARHAADTTGAGDAYAAGVISELLGVDRWPPAADVLRQAMRAGAALAGQVVRVTGAQARVPGEPPAAPAVLHP